MADTVIRSRIDSTVKLEAQAVLDKFGLSMSEAIRLFLHQVVLEKGIPFQVKLSADAAKEHDEWFRRQVHAALEEAENPATESATHKAFSAQWAEKKAALKSRAGKEKV